MLHRLCRRRRSGCQRVSPAFRSRFLGQLTESWALNRRGVIEMRCQLPRTSHAAWDSVSSPFRTDSRFCVMDPCAANGPIASDETR